MRIHSFESFGTVDGPGIRFVVFAQGCPLRCLYCHNPDTWSVEGAAKVLSPHEVVAEVVKYRNFIKSGGVTISGGEPLMQAREVAQIFDMCHAEGIHTALDTSGAIFNDDVKLALASTDLVLLDIKSADADMYPRLSGGATLERTLAFLDYLQAQGIKTWIRHVVVPGYTDDDEQLKRLSLLVDGYSVVERVELLPYHSLARHKYEAMNIPYPLGDTEQVRNERIEQIKTLFNK